MRSKFFASILIFIMGSLFLTGCKPIFQQKIDPYAQVRIKKDEMQNDVFYIKDGTEFVSVLAANTEKAMDISGKKRIMAFLTLDYKTVPTLYKNEIIAIASEKVELPPINVTRFREVGYSIGMYGLQLDEDGYYTGELKKNVYKFSNTYSLLSETSPSNNIRIVAINNEPVSREMISSSGVFNCMEKNAEYTIDYYAGTRYRTDTMISDVLTLEEYEYYTISDTSDSKNGYISYKMPDDAKSGWYYIKDAGMFRYIAFPKGVDESAIDMNEPYYTSQEERDASFSQKYSTTFDTRTRNVSMVFHFSAASLNMDDLDDYEDANAAIRDKISAVAYSPDGTSYEMEVDPENSTIACSLEEAMAGKWTIYIQPKDLVVTDMQVQSNKPEEEITEEDLSLSLTEKKINYRVTVNYEGEGTIYAILVDQNNQTHDFILDNKNHKLSCDVSFLDAGEYTVKVYHYPDTNVLDLFLEEDTKTESDIITITE